MKNRELYDEHDRVEKELRGNGTEFSKLAWQIVLNEKLGDYEVDAITLHSFLHGYCADFALALNQIFGYEIRKCGVFGIEDVVHYYCVDHSSTGKNEYIDVRGATKDYIEFTQEFSESIGVPTLDIYEERVTNLNNICRHDEVYNMAYKYIKNNIEKYTGGY